MKPHTGQKALALPWTDFDPGQIIAPKIQSFFDYWLSKSSGGKLPLACDIDILDAAFAAGSVSYIDVESNPERFFMRMIGSEVVRRYGKDFTRRYVDTIEDIDTRTMLLSSYGIAAASAEPFWIARQMFNNEHLYLYECLILPCRDESGVVTRLVSVLDWPRDSTNIPWS